MAKRKVKQFTKKVETPVVQDSLDSQQRNASRNNIKMHSVFLFVLALITYGNTLLNNWALDDTLLILGNSFTKEGLAGLKGIWTKDMFVGAHGREFELTGGRYRPLSLTVFALQVEFYRYRLHVLSHCKGLYPYSLSLQMFAFHNAALHLFL